MGSKNTKYQKPRHDEIRSDSNLGPALDLAPINICYVSTCTLTIKTVSIGVKYDTRVALNGALWYPGKSNIWYQGIRDVGTIKAGIVSEQ